MAAGSGDKPRTAVPAGKPRTIEFDTSVAHPARERDYLLGGKDNYAADRATADHVLEAAPFLVNLVPAEHAFLASAVRYLAAGLGVRQFLDIGTGLPAAGSTHQVAQETAPGSRVVYVDFDRCKSGCAHKPGSSGWAGSGQTFSTPSLAARSDL